VNDAQSEEALADRIAERVGAAYVRSARGYWNLGYWMESALNVAEALLRLADRVNARMAAAASARESNKKALRHSLPGCLSFLLQAHAAICVGYAYVFRAHAGAVE
jgi:hypothetical protein